MTSTHDDKSLAGLLDELAIALKGQKTGVLLIATSDNNSCRFAVQDGRITHCTFKRLHGDAAVQAFRQVDSGRSSFSEVLRLPFGERDWVEHEQAVVWLELEGRLQSAFSSSATPGELPPMPDPEPGFEGGDANKKRYYRGVLIEEDTPALQPASTESDEPENPAPVAGETQPAPARTKRFYRGVAVED